MSGGLLISGGSLKVRAALIGTGMVSCMHEAPKEPAHHCTSVHSTSPCA